MINKKCVAFQRDSYAAHDE